ncbi:MAG: UvrD-helicase domain-containing protein, partial [Bullifex sp.]
QFMEKEENRDYVSALSHVYRPENVIKDFFAEINHKLSFLSDTDPDEMLSFALEYTKARIDELVSFFSDEFSHIGDDLEGDVLTAFEAFMEKWNRGEYPPSLEFYNGRKRKGYLNGVKEHLKELNEIYKTQFAPAFSVLETLPSDKVYLEAIDSFSKLLKTEKRKRSALTFSDISSLALDILRNSTEIRRSVRDKYDYIMIDEFQDNNSTQRELLFLLSERPDSECGNEITAADISPEKLFFVGDDKQSIYRFRGADVSVFNELKDDLKRAGGENLTLSTNYRSEKVLIDHFNAVFKNVFSSGVHNYDAAFTETKYCKNTGCARTELALLDRADLIQGGLDAGECEAEYIADKISTMLTGDGYLINGRRPESQDIAILMRTGSNQMNIERSLKRRGSPYQVMDSRSLMTEALSSDLYALLQHMVYPEDKTAYTALLKSPFCRMSDMGILSLSKGEQPDEEDRIRLEHLNDFIADLKESMYTMSLPALIRKIYTDGGYRAYIENTDSYKAFSEHFEYLHSFAVSYSERGSSITDYIRFLRNNIGSYESTGEITVLKEKKEGVQIMTIHKSKGLEFPIVIVSSMGSKGRGETAEPLFSLEGRLLFDSSKGSKKLLNMEEAAMNDAEIKRILYVAMTRSENYLLLTGSYKLTKDGQIHGSTGKLLTYYLNAIGYSPLTGEAEINDVHITEIPALEDKAPDTSVERKDVMITPDQELPSFTFTPLRRKVTDDGDHTRTYERVPLSENEADEIITKYQAADRFGTLAHLAMELSMRGESLESLECDISDKMSEN